MVAAPRLTDAFVSIGMNDDSGTSVTDGRTDSTDLPFRCSDKTYHWTKSDLQVMVAGGYL